MPAFACEIADLELIGPVIDVSVGLGRAVARLRSDEGQELPTAIRLLALIDTSRRFHVIRPGPLVPLGEMNVIGMAPGEDPGAEQRHEQFVVNVGFPGGSDLDVAVIQKDIELFDVDLLLARDMHSYCELSYNGPGNRFTVSIAGDYVS